MTEESDALYEIKDPKAVLDALERAKADAKKYREESEASSTQNKTLSDRIAALEGDEGVALWKNRALSVSAKAELTKAGVKDVDRVLGFMDMAGVDLADDGKMTGFDKSLEAVKSKLPELFDNKRRVGGRVNSVDKDAGGDKSTKSLTEQQVDSFLHQS